MNACAVTPKKDFNSLINARKETGEYPQTYKESLESDFLGQQKERSGPVNKTPGNRKLRTCQKSNRLDATGGRS